jgi:hypothetical protein
MRRLILSWAIVRFWLQSPFLPQTQESDVGNEIADIQNGLCPVCRLHNLNLRRTPMENPANELHRDRCGDYDMTYKAASVLHDLSQDSPSLPKVAEFIWEQNSLGITPRIYSENIDSILSRRSLPFIERAKRFLTYLTDRSIF